MVFHWYRYSGRLGCTNNGKNCVCFKKFEDLDRSALVSLIREAVAAVLVQECIYGRNCARPVD